MLPSSDSNTNQPSRASTSLPAYGSLDISAQEPAPRKGSVRSEGVSNMLATQTFANPAATLLKELDASYPAQPSPSSASTIPPKEAQFSPVDAQTEDQAGSLQTTPESKSGYSSPDYYHGHSDISVQKSPSSATDQELFSASEDDSDSEDDEPSGFEPTEVADMGPAVSGALGSGDRACDFTSDAVHLDAANSDLFDGDSVDNSYEPADYSHPSRKRTFSYESYPIEATSPTESQLVEEGFEFHNQLSEERLVGRFSNEERLMRQFNHEAFQEAIKEVSPDLPRKQQWYTWRKVIEMLENHDATHAYALHEDAGEDDLFDDSDLPIDFSLGSLADESFGGCQCGGLSGNCTSRPGECGCTSCPRGQHTSAAQARSEHFDEQQDVPMVIGYTPITPSFPPIYHHPQPSRASSIQPSSHAGIRIPGLEPYEEHEAVTASRALTGDTQGASIPSNEGCGCRCGQNCQCPRGACSCDKTASVSSQAAPTNITICEPVGDPSAIAVTFDSREIWSDAATSGLSSPSTDPHEPEARGTTFPQIARTLTSSTVFSPVDAPTPAPGFRSPLPSPKRDVCSVPPPISRPDTPRPQAEAYDHGIRQSVEPEHATPAAYRESTPAYENRSLSPSPVSHTTPSDVEMQDTTPTQRERVPERETSVLPDAPETGPLSPPGSPNMSAGPLKSATGRGHGYSIPPPPIPVSPKLQPRKQRATSGSASPGKRNTKSGVQGSKIAKPQPKPRKVTGKIVKGKRDVTGARVRQAVDAIEDSIQKHASDVGSGVGGEPLVLQRDGTPPRRSERVRARSQSPCP